MKKTMLAALAVLSFSLAGSLLAPLANGATSLFPPNQYEGSNN